eukprot:50972_1
MSPQKRQDSNVVPFIGFSVAAWMLYKILISKPIVKSNEAEEPDQDDSKYPDAHTSHNCAVARSTDNTFNVKRMRQRVLYLQRQCQHLISHEPIRTSDLDDAFIDDISKAFIVDSLNAIHDRFKNQTPWLSAINSITATHDEECQIFRTQCWYHFIFGAAFIGTFLWRIHSEPDESSNANAPHKPNTNLSVGKPGFLRRTVHGIGSFLMENKDVIGGFLPKRFISVLYGTQESKDTPQKVNQKRDVSAVSRDLLLITFGFGSLYLPYKLYIAHALNEVHYRHRLRRAEEIYEDQIDSIKNLGKNSLAKFLYGINRANDEEIKKNFSNGIDITDIITLFMTDKMPQYFKTHTFSDNKMQDKFLNAIDDLMEHQTMSTNTRKSLLRYMAESQVQSQGDVEEKLTNELLLLNSDQYCG